MTSDSPTFPVAAQLPALRAYARTLTRNPHDAEDLLQEALTRAYERRHTLRADGNLRAWLMAIVHNVFASEWRRRQAAPAQAAPLHDMEDAAAVAPPQEHSVRLAQIERAFMQLPDDQRAALHLVTIEGMAYQEAADALQIPIGTLMSRLGRARAALRRFEDGMGEAAADRRARLRIVGGRDAA
ncbi:sigma-70 family RNA polymerase sigma factor [Bordetella bronchiseptica]|uniref:Sigma-70 region 2 n=2 Tax=Bordetella bronchiseptica TaxID=518 RepID=A0ABR4RGX8_BORBO|nr:sigma-70 family RNA polymerase sigma factor [Bordetella bronchiseptica]SHS79124.1 ECF subfamily RNA polymerase sigma-24 factor [Mycobacteroides abscessus subsp. abscessus]AZW22056.1 RNA polymerase subunit sigma [Bordetella bronchiseptica]KCV35972.1 sigma-70 region 2 [Bordetella bronchiseptica 00-P-2796]KDC02619.1 sigma-70 region 2 [Bordetella bronchiseptica E012]KDC11242.1 sigma-70 region 2 [Bordetella bronchiseptica E013]